MKKLIIAIFIVLCVGTATYFFPFLGKFFAAPGEMFQAVSTGMEIKQLETMIIGFSKKYERWPTEEEYSELVAENFNRDRNDSLLSSVLVDVWGEPYNYFRQGSGFVIVSMGPDKKPGTTDDMILLRHK